MTWRTTRTEGFTTAQIAASELAAIVISATSSGCGISFGQTKDHCAVVITVFAGNSGKEVTYARSESDVHDLLSDLNSEEFMKWAEAQQPV